MKKLILLAALALGFTSCSEDTIINNYDVTVENVTVEFGAKNFLTESSGAFGKKTASFDSSYTHALPTEFVAYFIAHENRGNYSMGDVIAVLDVETGMQTITIPKMEYVVYVTNYNNPNSDGTLPYAWYTWSDAVQQLPASTHDILMFGSEIIDYKTVTSGSVTVDNYHSAVMIKNNESLSPTSAPFFNTGNVDYEDIGDWYLLYIRNSTTSTQVPLSFNTPNGTTYQLDKPIEPNKIYQYTLNPMGDVDGNLEVITVPLQEGVAEEIDILD